MIKEVKKKMYFVSVPLKNSKIKKVEEDFVPTVSVAMKYLTLEFKKKTLDDLGMHDRFLRFYTQSPNIIGWKIFSKLSQEELGSKAFRFVKMNEKTRSYKVSAAPILRQLIGLKDESYLCEIKKYIEIDQINKGQVYYFIELKNEKSSNKNTGDSEIESTLQGEEEQVLDDSENVENELSTDSNNFNSLRSSGVIERSNFSEQNVAESIA